MTEAYRDLTTEQHIVCPHSAWATFIWWVSVQLPWQPRQRKSQRSLAPCSESSTFSQGFCWQPHGRWLMEPKLGPGTASPLLWAWEDRAAAARGAKMSLWATLIKVTPSFTPACCPSEIWWKWGVRTTKGVGGMEATETQSEAWRGGNVGPGKWLPGPSP